MCKFTALSGIVTLVLLVLYGESYRRALEDGRDRASEVMRDEQEVEKEE